MILVARSGALYERDSARLTTIGRSYDLSSGRAIDCRHSFEHHVRNNIGAAPEPKVLDARRVIRCPPGCGDDSCDAIFPAFWLLAQPDCVVLAGLLTGRASFGAGGSIDRDTSGKRVGVRKERPPLSGQSVVEFVRTVPLDMRLVQSPHAYTRRSHSVDRCEP